MEGQLARYERTETAGPAAVAHPDWERTVLYVEDNLANITLVQRILDQRDDIEGD